MSNFLLKIMMIFLISEVCLTEEEKKIIEIDGISAGNPGCMGI